MRAFYRWISWRGWPKDDFSRISTEKPHIINVGQFLGPWKSSISMESWLDISLVPSYSDLESRLYMERTITNRVKELRAAREWTQEQLAQEAGVSRQSINSIERNRYVPSLELALVFARIFACSTDEIFQLEKKK